MNHLQNIGRARIDKTQLVNRECPKWLEIRVLEQIRLKFDCMRSQSSDTSRPYLEAESMSVPNLVALTDELNSQYSPGRYREGREDKRTT